MEFGDVLTTIVYPLVFTILSAILLKVVVPWINKQAAKTENELLKQGALIAITAVEETASFAKKKGEEKWTPEKKQATAEQDLTDFAKNRGIAVSPEDVTRLVKSVLGEKKI